ncbi:MAG: hypothetical protein ACQCN4_01460 [Candidatus Bathyarchaeia archaeon]
MSKRSIKSKMEDSKLFDWMLAIDFDPFECGCSRKNSDLISGFLSE